jgi:hypothetical protein
VVMDCCHSKDACEEEWTPTKIDLV